MEPLDPPLAVGMVDAHPAPKILRIRKDGLGMGMLIAHVITRLLRAGSEENTIHSCMSQATAGHKVVLIHGNEWNAQQVERCRAHMQVICVDDLVHAIDLAKDIAATRALSALFRSLRPDIVHTHQSKAGIIGRVAARMAKVPVIVHGVHIVPFASVGPLQKLTYLAAERAVAGCTNAFVNVSEGTRRSYIQNSVGRPEQHFVAHSGFNVGIFKQPGLPEDWLEICGLRANAPRPSIILMLAALEPRKRHVEFLQAFARVLHLKPDVRLLLAGDGPTHEAVVAVIARLNLSENVKLLGFHPQPDRLISLCDFTVLASSREGLPRVVVQSLAGGKPVVTTRLPGIEELVKDGVNGLITPEDDLDASARAVLSLLKDSERLRQMQQKARETDVSSWSVESMCSTLDAIYERFIADESRAPQRLPTHGESCAAV